MEDSSGRKYCWRKWHAEGPGGVGNQTGEPLNELVPMWQLYLCLNSDKNLNSYYSSNCLLYFNKYFDNKVINGVILSYSKVLFCFILTPVWLSLNHRRLSVYYSIKQKLIRGRAEAHLFPEHMSSHERPGFYPRNKLFIASSFNLQYLI